MAELNFVDMYSRLDGILNIPIPPGAVLNTSGSPQPAWDVLHVQTFGHAVGVCACSSVSWLYPTGIH